MKEIIKRVQALRECGHVERAHTTPHHGSYNNAAHSWQLVILILILHPAPSANLILAAMFHDVPERWTGDIPGIFKGRLASERIINDLKSFENEVLDDLELLTLCDLDDDEMKWLKACDMLEFWLWCHDQLAMGNRHVSDMMANSEKWFKDNWDRIPPQVKNFKSAYQWHRTSDIDGWKNSPQEPDDIKEIKNWEEEDWLSRTGE